MAFQATTAPTVVGLTNHAFWNLAGPGAHRPVDGHHVAVNAARVLRFDEDQVPLPGPTGPGRRHPAPPHWQRPGRRPAAGQLLRARHAAHLGGRPPRNPDSGRQLCLSTDQTGMGVSTGDGLHPPRAGPCLHPALARAPNRPDFPSARLDPGQTYTATTRYAFSVADRTPLPHPGPSPPPHERHPT
ncbi:aldose epimerase family protein [Streptomyces lydicamycinicus]|uniref:aldose epimerase family protein n=1 Tax=Streptomyces lydicamycinicus TaxID=1546107 RepID=UPI003C2DEB2C